MNRTLFEFRLLPTAQQRAKGRPYSYDKDTTEQDAVQQRANADVFVRRFPSLFDLTLR